VHRRVDALRTLERHALRALEQHEVLQGPLAERHQRQRHARGIVVRRRGQVRPRQMRSRADRREHVLHQREVQHLLGGHVSDRPAPARHGLELLRLEPLVLALLERERREQVLAHDPVLDLGGLAQHVDQLLAMLDHERRLGLRPPAAQRQHLREATPPRARIRISHSGHRPRSGHVVCTLRGES
jgi:hypothetical protein